MWGKTYGFFTWDLTRNVWLGGAESRTRRWKSNGENCALAVLGHGEFPGKNADFTNIW